MNWVHSDRVPLVPGPPPKNGANGTRVHPSSHWRLQICTNVECSFWAPRLHLKPSGVGHGFGYRSMICAFHSGSH